MNDPYDLNRLRAIDELDHIAMEQQWAALKRQYPMVCAWITGLIEKYGPEVSMQMVRATFDQSDARQ